MTSKHSNALQYSEPWRVALQYPMLNPKQVFQLPCSCQRHDMISCMLFSWILLQNTDEKLDCFIFSPPFFSKNQSLFGRFVTSSLLYWSIPVSASSPHKIFTFVVSRNTFRIKLLCLTLKLYSLLQVGRFETLPNARDPRNRIVRAMEEGTV